MKVAIYCGTEAMFREAINIAERENISYNADIDFLSMYTGEIDDEQAILFEGVATVEEI